ncbi:unnamed protein product [Vicia faba]|uniref:Uncharacterized protein n=1 Tax=Vicia faba TaxID=3906 RepID=A0AAV1A734_VICFA|nr:unnamed protein product [Vicia faba]
MSGDHGATPNAEDSTPVRQKIPKLTTDQNLVIISGWIKYGIDSVVGRNQKSDSYWGKIAYYCNEHCSFDPPRDGAACRNYYNYMNKILNKWTSAYDNAKCSGSKRAHESDPSDSNSMESSARPMGRDVAKKGAKKMNMFMKLSSKEHLDDRSKELLEKLGRNLFGN